ncbi:hypothetical protein GOBAR_DD09878 [Gossypium barbadense]|nr:hypothetical protein GOBAR_DD09878 [Gossypium barbadense]
MTSTTSESSSLPDAEERSATSNLTAWLGKLKDAPYDADDLLHELSFDVFRRLLFPWSRANNYVYLPTMSSQIQVTRMKTTEKENQLYDKGNDKVECKDFPGLEQAFKNTAWGEIPEYLESIAIQIEKDQRDERFLCWGFGLGYLEKKGRHT